MANADHNGTCADCPYILKCKGDNPSACSSVVVIGNGPSGMCLSYLLSGTWPYYNGQDHPNPYLHERLRNNTDKSLVEQDLRMLSEGLEGRSRHPVAVLFDSLQHPKADQGERMKSRMDWKHLENRTIPHVVLGSGKPGGAWWHLDVSVLTLSLGCWMELPGLDFKKWIAEYRSKMNIPDSLANQFERVTLGEVARYYQSYVSEMNLQGYFRPHTVVTSVERLRGKRVKNDESGEQETTCKKCFGMEGENLFEVKGYYKETSCGCKKEFSILTPNVVLATGMLGKPNKLGAVGEDLPFVKTKLSDLEACIQEGDLTFESPPILVVGAGLSAADAVECARSNGIRVIHCFRRKATDPDIALAKLPQMVYPEYHKVLQFMKGQRKEDWYTGLSQHTVTKFLPDMRVVVQGEEDTKTLNISIAGVFIGAEPDLSFLPNYGKDLGIRENEAINCRSNPISVDPFTMETTSEKGLFAMGPLVGDNFVRFSFGGALAITKHLISQKIGYKNSFELNNNSTEISVPRIL